MKNLLSLLLLAVCSFCQAQQVSCGVSVCAMGTNTKLTSLRVGQSFDLVLVVQDLRPSGTWVDSNGATKAKVRGVFAAYCDVSFDPSLAKLTYYNGSSPAEYLGCFTFSPRYANGQKAAKASDCVNDVGAFTSAFTGNTVPAEVWRVRMTTRKPGALVFRPSVAQVQHPQCDTLVYGNIAADPPEQSYVAENEIVMIPCAVTVSP